MARKQKQTTENESGIPKPHSRSDFARRLYNLMLQKGWRQSELGRRAGLPRDSISTYIRGKTLPTASSVVKLARALGVDPEELMPFAVEHNATTRGSLAEVPALNLTVSPSNPAMAYLQINQHVPTELAMRLISLLNEHNRVAS